MLVDFRCGQCRKLLARITPASELQIKCGRCRTLNHVNATSVEPSPASDPLAECSADPTIAMENVIMSLTPQDIQDCKALVTSIWGASVADNLDYNEEVVEVVRTTVEQISLCSQRLADFFSALIIVVGGVAAAVYSREWLVKGAQKIADQIQELKDANFQARACIAQAAATYRSPLEMASLGI